MQKIEIWQAIKNYEGLYEISNLGNCRSIDRYVKYKGIPARTAFFKGKNIYKILTKEGYIKYRLTNSGKTHGYFAHRLVAAAFIPNPYNKPQVNHIDSDRANNNLTNLEWCTNSENLIHSYNNGRVKRYLGKLIDGSKAVVQILNGINIKIWKSSTEAGITLGLNSASIIKCCNNNKKCGGYDWKYI